MKKFLIILLAILCIPISSYAISLSTLENNPERYLKIYENPICSLYLDTYSVKSVHYSPPYYTLKAKTFNVLYYSNRIYVYFENYNYDYSYSPQSTRKRIISEMNQCGETLDENVIKTRLNNALKENCGIYSVYDSGEIYTLEGKLTAKFDDMEPIYNDITYNTSNYYKANAVFKTYYKQDF